MKDEKLLRETVRGMVDRILSEGQIDGYYATDGKPRSDSENTFMIDKRDFLKWMEENDEWHDMDYNSADKEGEPDGISSFNREQYDRFYNSFSSYHSRREFADGNRVDMRYMRLLPEQFPVDIAYYVGNGENMDGYMKDKEDYDGDDDRFHTDPEQYIITYWTTDFTDTFDGPAPGDELYDIYKHFRTHPDDLKDFYDIFDDYLQKNFDRIAKETYGNTVPLEDDEFENDIYSEGKKMKGNRIKITESRLKEIVQEGTRHVLEQIMNEQRPSGSETVIVNMDEAIYEFEQAYNIQLDTDAEWLQDLPYEIPVEVYYAIEGGDPDTYDTPGTGTTYHVLNIEMNGFDTSSLPGDQEEMVNTMVNICINNNFQDFMEGDHHNLGKPNPRWN